MWLTQQLGKFLKLVCAENILVEKMGYSAKNDIVKKKKKRYSYGIVP